MRWESIIPWVYVSFSLTLTLILSPILSPTPSLILSLTLCVRIAGIQGLLIDGSILQIALIKCCISIPTGTTYMGGVWRLVSTAIILIRCRPHPNRVAVFTELSGV